jgi:hypothetical protein
MPRTKYPAHRKLRLHLDKIRRLESATKIRIQKTGSVPKDRILNRCLSHIESMRGQSPVHEPYRERLLVIAFNVYRRLQALTAPERQDYNDKREVPLDVAEVDALCAQAYTGGLGFAHMPLGSLFMSYTHQSKSIWLYNFWVPNNRWGTSEMGDHHWFCKPIPE